MAGQSRRALILGFGGAVLLFVLVFSLVGIEDILREIIAADPRYVAVMFGLALCWLFAWGLMLRAALNALGIQIRARTSFFIYSGVVFANNVTPFGQAGGEPVAALLVSEVSDSRYESGLAGIASVDLCNVVSSLTLLFLGLGYHATTATIGEQIETVVGSAVVLITIAAVALLVLWRSRERLVERVPGLLAPLLVGILPNYSDTATLQGSLRERLRGLFENFERLGTDRRSLLTVFSLSILGWLLQAGALLAAFAAVGAEIPVAVVLFSIPLANVAGVTPLPGGLGAIESMFIAIIAPTTPGISGGVVAAAVLLFRAAIYWLPVFIGGVTASVLGVRAVA